VIARSGVGAKEKQHVHHRHRYVKGTERAAEKQHDEVEKDHDHHHRLEREKEHGHEEVTLHVEVDYGEGYDREEGIDRAEMVPDDPVSAGEVTDHDPHHGREAEIPVREHERGYGNDFGYHVVASRSLVDDEQEMGFGDHEEGNDLLDRSLVHRLPQHVWPQCIHEQSVQFCHNYNIHRFYRLCVHHGELRWILPLAHDVLSPHDHLSLYMHLLHLVDPQTQ